MASAAVPVRSHGRALCANFEHAGSKGLRLGELLIPIAGCMKRGLLAGSYIQADETPVGVQTNP